MSKNKINNNSRFSSLLKEKTVSPNNNNNNNNNNNVPPSIQQRQPVINKYSKSKKEVMREELHKNKLKKEKQDLAPESFPVLASPTKNNQAAEVIIKSSFMEKLNSVIVVENKDDEFKNLELGWISIKRDINTGKNIIREKKKIDNPITPTPKDPTHEINLVLEKTYKARTDEYIEMWGYDQWEKMFIIPDYDYEYFEDLDDIYYEDIENSECDSSDYDE